MRLLVTGGAGFIGSCFVHQALSAGDEVLVLDALTYAGHRANLEQVPNPQNLTLQIGNICDGGLVARLLKEYAPDALVHFAAESHVDNSITSPAAFVQTNVVGTYTLLEAARGYWDGLKGKPKKAFRFIQISTDEVYGSLGKTGAFKESSKYNPHSPYSATKAAGDHLARAWHDTYGMPTIVTNCSNNYGPRQYPEKLIPHMILCALQGHKLPIYGDGKNIRDWIHVEDHCRGIRLALEKGRPGHTYAFGGHAERTNLQVVTALCEILDTLQPRPDGGLYKEQMQFVADRPGHDMRYAIDDHKACKKLGFSHHRNFEQGLRETVQWYLSNPRWVEQVMVSK